MAKHEQGEVERGWLAELRAGLDGPLLWLGVAVGVLSAISAIARLLDVGLVGVFHDLVQFYRGLLRPLYEFVNWSAWPLHLPALVVDLFAVYAVLVAMGIRTEASGAVFQAFLRSYATGFERRRASTANRIVGAFFLIPVFSLAPVRDFALADTKLKQVQIVFNRDYSQSDALTKIWKIRQSMKRSLYSFVALPLALIIFFLLNAYV